MFDVHKFCVYHVRTVCVYDVLQSHSSWPKRRSDGWTSWSTTPALEGNRATCGKHALTSTLYGTFDIPK